MIDDLSLATQAQKVSGQAGPVLFSSLFAFSRREVDAFFARARVKKKGPGYKLLQAAIQEINQLPNFHENSSASVTLTNQSPAVSHGKLLIVTPRKFGKAHDRNLIRRRLKAIFYEEKLYSYKVISVMLLYQEAQKLSFCDLKNILLQGIPPRHQIRSGS